MRLEPVATLWPTESWACSNVFGFRTQFCVADDEYIAVKIKLKFGHSYHSNDPFKHPHIHIHKSHTFANRLHHQTTGSIYQMVISQLSAENSSTLEMPLTLKAFQWSINALGVDKSFVEFFKSVEKINTHLWMLINVYRSVYPCWVVCCRCLVSLTRVWHAPPCQGTFRHIQGSPA